MYPVDLMKVSISRLHCLQQVQELTKLPDTNASNQPSERNHLLGYLECTFNNITIRGHTDAMARDVKCCGWSGYAWKCVVISAGHQELTILTRSCTCCLFRYLRICERCGRRQCTRWQASSSSSWYGLDTHRREDNTNRWPAASGACATIASDALMNPFDGTC